MWLAVTACDKPCLQSAWYCGLVSEEHPSESGAPRACVHVPCKCFPPLPRPQVFSALDRAQRKLGFNHADLGALLRCAVLLCAVHALQG